MHVNRNLNLLIFNLRTDADDPTQGFNTVWINKLAENFNKVVVITPRKGRLALRNNVEVRSLGKEKGYKRTRMIINFYTTLFTVLRKEDIHLCFSHMASVLVVMGSPLLMLWRVRVTMWHAHPSVPLAVKVASRISKAVFTSRPEAFPLKRKNLMIIGQGIDVDNISVKESFHLRKPFKLITVGRIYPIKDVDVMIQAVDILVNRKNRDDIELSIIGDAVEKKGKDYIEYLKNLVVRKKIENYVHFLGSLPNQEVLKLYKEYDLFINLCRGAFNKTVLEAMAAKIPVVVSNETYKDILESVSTDFFLEKKEPEFLAERIVKIMKEFDEDAKSVEGKCAQLREIVVNEHSIDQLVGKIVNVLVKLYSEKFQSVKKH